MSVTRKDVEHIAKLARLKFNDEELEKYTHDLNEILTYVEKLNELDTKNIEPLSHPVEGSNVFRNDELNESIPNEEAIKNAPASDDNFFKVPKVIKS